MAKTSSASAADVKDYGVAEDRSTQLEGYTVNFVVIREDHDLAPILATLPTGRCECPHWGYVLQGRMTVDYASGETEVFEAGDAFYMAPGHAPRADAGSRFVQFSPTDELAATEAALAAAMSAQ
jgi:mannose-6-phosphate isomerase-like protein (cupin superfamily)